MLKRIISILLAALITASCVTFAYADNTTARVYSIYSDNMLFKQNEEAIIAGTGEQGAEITVELLLGDSVVSSGRSFVGDDGTFCVSFNAPAGGYDTYTVLLKENGTEFKKLENVVFGELWLSSGQSNMQYPLGQEKYGSEMMNKSEKLSPWIRTLIIPVYPEYNGSNELVPYEPQNDIIDARWITGESSEIYGMSAVAYFFAAKMQESLDMPVGILNLSLGGSSIASWLSRDAVDGCDSVKNDFINNNRYIEKSDWKDDEINVYVDMTGNYNLRINPVRHFKLSGMIWYQGESDIGWSGEEYENSFNLMQTSYTKLFNYQNGLLPIVYSQLAAYFYDESGFCLPERNVDFTEIQQKEASSRAVVPIYDIPLTFIPGVGSIHLEHKKEIGERMAFAADGLVYGKRDSYSAPAITASEIKDGAIYVTLNNVGDGLKINGESEEGFAVCGDDGIYVKADAEVVSNNTVKIFNEDVTEPKSASYAFSVSNMSSNLYATENGNLALPASPFITNTDYSTKFWIEKPWADNESDKVWRTHNDEYSAFYPLWKGENAELSYTSESAFSGNLGLTILSNGGSFSANPLISFKNGISSKSFADSETDYSNYGTLTMKIKNNGKKDVVLSGIRFQRNSLMWYSPSVNGENDIDYVISADGEWHSVTFDLNKLYLFGNECGISVSNRALSNVKNIEFLFSSDINADISLDHIRFTSSKASIGFGFDADVSKADNLFEFISALFVSLLGVFAEIL